MGVNTAYAEVEPTREEVDALEGASVIEFGSPWCGHCGAAQPLLATALAGHPHVRHLKIEDGSGRPLGRSFGVKLWPTLIFMCAGKETGRLVRPRDQAAIEQALAQVDAS